MNIIAWESCCMEFHNDRIHYTDNRVWRFPKCMQPDAYLPATDTKGIALRLVERDSVSFTDGGAESSLSE